MGILRLKVNDKYYKVIQPNNKCKRIYMINTSNICIKDKNNKSENFKQWLENYFKGDSLPNAYIKDQRYILALLKIDPVTKEKYLEEARTKEILVFEKDYFTGNGVYIKGINRFDELDPIDYSRFHLVFNGWSVEDFNHFEQNYYKFIDAGEIKLGQLLSNKLVEDDKGIKLVKEYFKR